MNKLRVFSHALVVTAVVLGGNMVAGEKQDLLKKAVPFTVRGQQAVKKVASGNAGFILSEVINQQVIPNAPFYLKTGVNIAGMLIDNPNASYTELGGFGVTNMGSRYGSLNGMKAEKLAKKIEMSKDTTGSTVVNAVVQGTAKIADNQTVQSLGHVAFIYYLATYFGGSDSRK